jgi:hypothetical protein
MSMSVTPEKADTTTSAVFSRLAESFIISAIFLRASGEPTDEPPNFITSIKTPTFLWMIREPEKFPNNSNISDYEKKLLVLKRSKDVFKDGKYHGQT